MQFDVPQFIEVEDKIFGPLTFRQFVYLAGAAGISFILYTFIPSPFSFLFIAPVAALGAALAFFKINNRPFVSALESAVRFWIKDRLYIWKKNEPVPGKKRVAATEEKKVDAYIPRLSDSKLKEMSWSLDVHKNIQ